MLLGWLIGWAAATPTRSFDAWLADRPEGRVEAKIEGAVAEAVQRPPRVVLDLTTREPVPDHLVGQPAEILHAWALARALAGRMPEPGLGDGSGEPELQQVIDDLLEGRGADHQARLHRTGWHSFCGTGYGDFAHRRARALVLAALLAGDHTSAAGHAVEAARWGWAPWQRDYLAWHGLELDLLLIGSAVHERDPVWLAALAGAGDDRAAGLALLVGDLDNPHLTSGWRDRWLFTLHEYVEPGKPKGGILAFPPEPRPYASEARQQEILAILIGALQPDGPVEELDAASWALWHLRRPESVPALQRALGFDNRPVAERAAETLRAMGHPVAPLEPLPDARFRFSTPSGPLHGTPLRWEVSYEGQRSTADTLTTDAGGLALLSRDVLDASGRNLMSVRFEAAPDAAWDDPLFDVSIPIRSTWARVEVPVDLAPLTLQLDGTRATEATVVLSRTDGDRRARFRLRVPIQAGTLVVPRLQRGRYDVSLVVADAAVWTASDLGVRTHRVTLQPGGSLDYEIVAPGAVPDQTVVELRIVARRRVRHPPEGWLERDVVQPWSFAGPEGQWVGLPAGTYELRVLSSDERLALPWIPNPPARSPHQGLTRRFTLAPGATVDLGLLSLPAR